MERAGAGVQSESNAKVIYYHDISKGYCVSYHMETIGERLKTFAKVHYGSMKRLSEAIGERPDNLQKYASDKHQPGAKLLIKLAAEGLNIRWLLTGDESMYASDEQGSSLAQDDVEMLAMLKKAGIENSRSLGVLLSEMKTVLGARAELRKWFRH